MPDHGREPCLPCDSGKKEKRRIQRVRRFSRAAVFNVERTSITSHPCDPSAVATTLFDLTPFKLHLANYSEISCAYRNVDKANCPIE